MAMADDANRETKQTQIWILNTSQSAVTVINPKKDRGHIFEFIRSTFGTREK